MCLCVGATAALPSRRYLLLLGWWAHYEVATDMLLLFINHPGQAAGPPPFRARADKAFCGHLLLAGWYRILHCCCRASTACTISPGLNAASVGQTTCRSACAAASHTMAHRLWPLLRSCLQASPNHSKAAVCLRQDIRPADTQALPGNYTGTQAQHLQHEWGQSCQLCPLISCANPAGAAGLHHKGITLTACPLTLQALPPHVRQGQQGSPPPCSG